LVVGGGEFMATLAASNRRTRLRVWWAPGENPASTLVDASDDDILGHRSPPWCIVEESLHHPCWVLSVGVVVLSCSSPSARWCTSLGSAWMSGRRLWFVASAVLRWGVWVSVLIAWAFWLLTYVERGLRIGVLHFVLYRFLASFPYKLANSIFLYHWKGKSFASFKKKLGK
jgi:hypothetical protein